MMSPNLSLGQEPAHNGVSDLRQINIFIETW